MRLSVVAYNNIIPYFTRFKLFAHMLNNILLKPPHLHRMFLELIIGFILSLRVQAEICYVLNLIDTIKQ